MKSYIIYSKEKQSHIKCIEVLFLHVFRIVISNEASMWLTNRRNVNTHDCYISEYKKMTHSVGNEVGSSIKKCELAIFYLYISTSRSSGIFTNQILSWSLSYFWNLFRHTVIFYLLFSTKHHWHFCELEIDAFNFSIYWLCYNVTR